MAQTYTAVIKHDHPWWIGWIEEVPGTNCQESAREKLLESLRIVLPEALRILQKLEFHYIPKHASWLNMVEIELSILVRQCLGQRIEDLFADPATLVKRRVTEFLECLSRVALGQAV